MNIFQFQNLLLQNVIKHGISTKFYGTIKNQNNSINKDNLANFLNDLDLPVQNAIKMTQVHSGNVAVVKESRNDPYNETDGLITDKRNTPIYVLTADCLPILFYDPEKKVIGVAHGGRKGLQKRITDNMIERFVSDFGSDVKDIVVGMGPGIEKNCYEVDSELMDIRKMAKNSLLNKGIKEENIEISDLCTKCRSDVFFSYRNGDEYKRFASVISIV